MKVNQGSEFPVDHSAPSRLRKVLVYLLCEAMILQPVVVLADPVAANGATTVYQAPNGVPVVDIAKPNSAGLSHNVFNSYSVDSRGVVLNNGNSSELTRQSQLAGQVTANMNLDKEARVILNEVVKPGRSNLEGYTEVLGGSANVVIANPYGITCKGCGFINTPNVTLTTGVPSFGSTGELTGFRVGSGDILITGAGLDATRPDYLSLVARSLYVDGRINAKDLSIATGSNEWDYASRTISGTVAGTGAAPAYALDSTLLGGMYADRIHVQATEAGVGVRMLGDAAASADDFTLDAAGRIVLLGKLSAQRDLHIGSAATDSDALTLTDASLSAKHDVSLSAAGGLGISGGIITADNRLDIVAATLTDTASVNAAVDNNQRYAAGKVNVSVTGAMMLDGVNWGAGTDFLATTGSFAVGSRGATVYAKAGFNLAAVNDLDLGTGAFSAALGMDLSAGRKITVRAGSQGIQTAAGDIILRAGSGLDNAATFSADTGRITIRGNGALGNSGVLYAAGDIDIADFSGGGTQTLGNSGKILSDAALLIKAASVGNQSSGVMQAATGAVLTADSLSNDGIFTASTTAGKNGVLKVGALTNTGVLQSAGSLTASVSTSLGNSGKLLANYDLAVAAGSNAIMLTNSANGVMQAGDALSFTGSNAALKNFGGASLIGNSASLTLGNLENAGIMQTETGMNLAIGNTLANSGTLLAKGVLTANAGSLSNSGGLQADQGATINITGALVNSGKLIASSAAGYGATLTASTLSNVTGGSIQSAQDLQINIGGNSVTNAGKIIAAGDMTLTSTGSGLALTNQSGAYLQSGSNGGDVLTVNGNSVSMSNNAGGSLLGNAITLNLAGLSNYGLVQGGSGTSAISSSGGIDNHAILHSSGNLNLSGAWFNNYAQASAGTNLTLSFSGGVYNDRALFAGSLLKSNYSTTFTNASNGTLNSNGSIDLAAATFVNNSDITAQGNITITAATFQNDVAGDLTRAWGSKVYTGDDVSNGSNIYSEYGGGCSCNKEYFHYYHLWTQTQYFVNGDPTALDRPKIMGVGGSSQVTIKGFNSGSNRGGIISGNNVTLTGNGGSSTFINDDLSLLKRDGRDTWDNLVFWYGVPGAAASAGQGRVNDAEVIGAPSVNQTFGAGIFANGGSISVSGISTVVNKSGTQKGGSVTGADSSVSTTGGASAVSGTSTASGAPAVNFGGLVIELPVSPYGYFVLPLDPDAQYLVELNPLFSSGSSYLGSNYLADRLGYDPDTLMRRLGDAAYETYLVREQLVARTGNNILQGYASETQQMQSLMDAAASQMGTLGLKFGAALDAKQIAGLDQDIVWMVETEIAGQKVLAPVVYLSQATRDSIVSGAVIAASKDVNMDVGSLTNAGGTVAAGNTLTIVAKDDIRNTGGTISASNMALVSTDGKVINETTVTRAGDKDNYEDVAGKTGTITAKNNLVISGQKGVNIVGATVSAGESAVLHSESGDINIQSLALEKKTTTEKQDRGLFYSSSEKTVETSQQRLASSVTVGDGKDADAQLTLLAEKGNVNLLSADIASSGGINVMAKDINVSALNLENSKTRTSSSSGISVSGGAMTIGSSSSSSEVKSSTAVGSSLSAGGALNMLAAGDIVLEGGSYSAKTVSLDATNVITKAAKNTYSSSSSSSSAGLTVGNGSMGGGARSASDSLDVTQHGNAQIVAADGIAITAKKTVDIGGLDAAVRNKAPAPEAGSADAAVAAETAAVVTPKAAAPGFDVNALKAAVAAGTADSFIAGTGRDGMGVGVAMADMTQAATGQLAISGENVISTKFKDEYRKTSESSSTYVGIGTQSQGPESGAPASAALAVTSKGIASTKAGDVSRRPLEDSGIDVSTGTSSKSPEQGVSAGMGLSISSSYSKESTSEKRDGINSLSADNISIEGKKGISLKGVAIAGGSSVALKSEGDITISAAEVDKQHALESHSMHLDVGTTVSAGEDKGPLNVTGPLEVQATFGFGVQTHSLNESSKGHIDSTLSSDGALSIESGKGNVTWTGVTASADTLSIKADNFTSAAYQDSATVSESSNSLGINLSVGTDIGKTAQSIFQGNGSKSTTLQRSSTDEIGNTIVARSANIDVKDNVTLVGGNLIADDVRIKANTVDIKAEKSTLDEHKTEVGVSLVMDGSAAFMGNKAWGSIDSMKAGPESGTSQSTDHAERTGDGRVNNGKAVSDELLSGRTGLSITSSETTTKGESYRNATLQFNQLAIDTTAPAGSTRGDGHVDIGGASLLGSGAGSSIGITTGELKSTKYVDKTEVTSHDNSTFIGVAVEGHSAIADTINHEKTLQDKKAQGMTLDEGWVAAQRAADASNMAMGDAVGGSVAATVRNIDTKTHSVSTSENTTYLSAENISIKTTQGNLALNGVEFNAPPVYNGATGKMEKAAGPRPGNVSLDSAKDISLTAAKSTYAETSTTLTNDFNVTGSGSISGSGSGVGLDVGYNGSIDSESLNRTSYANASLSADNVSIKSKNLSLTGANVSGGNVKVDVEKDISIASVQDTQTQSTSRGNWGGSVGLNTTTVVSVNGQGGGGDSHDNYAKTAQQSSITAEKNLDVAAGGNLTLTGAKLASAGTGSVKVKGDLTVNKLDDFHEKDGLFAGASGGINQGGVNAGINLEKVDQVHNATTQNSTISGVSLDVAGKTQGDNLKADGSLQTQATTVLKDEKIAGVYVNGTGVVTKSGVKKVATAATVAAKTVASVGMPARPQPSAAETATKVTVAEKPASITAPVTGTGKKYDSAVAVVTREKDGSIDPAVQTSVDAIKASHPDTIVVTTNRDGKVVEGADRIADAKGNVRVDVIDHGATLRDQGPEKTAALIRNVMNEVAKNPQVKETKRVELVACGTGSCSVSNKPTLGQEVTALLAKPGLEVAEHNSPIQVQADGSRVAENGVGAQKLVSSYAQEGGVSTTYRDKRADELVPALDAERELGPPGADLVKQSSKVLVRGLSGKSLASLATTPLTTSVRRPSLVQSAPVHMQARDKHIAASGSMKSFVDEKKMQADLSKLTEPTMVSTYDSREQALKQNPNLPLVEEALEKHGHAVAYEVDVTKMHEPTPQIQEMNKRAADKNIDMSVLQTPFLRSMSETSEGDGLLVRQTADSLSKTKEIRRYEAIHTAFPEMHPKAPGSEVYKQAFAGSPLAFVETRTIERHGTVESVPQRGGESTKKMTVKKAEVTVFERENGGVPSPKKYDSAVAVITRERDGTLDPVAQTTVDAIKAKYPETKIVEADRDGNIIKGGEQLDDVKGSVRVDMIDHGDKMREQGAERVTALAKGITERIDANPHKTDTKRLELVTCGEGSCSVKKRSTPTLGAELAANLARPGLHVVEHDSAIQVQDNAVRVAQKGDHGKTVHNVLTKDGVVETVAREKRADEQVVALDPSRRLGKKGEAAKKKQSDDEESVKERESSEEESDQEAAPPPASATQPRTVRLEDARSGTAPGFFTVGGGQSKVLYRLDASHEHVSGSGVVKRSDEATIERPPRSYDDDRDAQIQRHLATVADTFLKPVASKRGKHQEVQVARDKETGALVLSTNTTKGNKELRLRLDELRKYMAGTSKGGSSDRQKRHHNKLRGELSPEDIANMRVISREEEGGNNGLHAERRLSRAGYSDPHGTMRPCATCFGNLDTSEVDDLSRTGPGKTWVSKSANADGGGEKISNFRTRTTVTRDGKYTDKHGSESDTDDSGDEASYPRSYMRRDSEDEAPSSSASPPGIPGLAVGADIHGNGIDAWGNIIPRRPKSPDFIKRQRTQKEDKRDKEEDDEDDMDEGL